MASMLNRLAMSLVLRRRVLSQLPSQRFVEEADLAHAEFASIRKTGVVATDLKKHFAVDRAERMGPLARFAIAGQSSIRPVTDEFRRYLAAKKSTAIARSTFRSLSSSFASDTGVILQQLAT